MYELIIHLVFLHDSVERFNPHWIDISIQDNPFWSFSGDVCLVSHDDGKESIFPFTGGRVDDAVQLIICHCLFVSIG